MARVLVYAGRFAGELKDIPANFKVLSEWEVLPLRLAAAMEGVSVLVVLDPLSFPFDVLGEEQWDVPMVVALPPDLGVESLIGLFDGPLFRRLGFFDRVAVSESSVWEQLRPRYGWGENQVVPLEEGAPERAFAGICATLVEPEARSHFGGEEEYEAIGYWSERGSALAASIPHKAICSVHHDLRFNKAMHRVQARALEPRFAAFEAAEESGLRQDVLEVGAGVGRWAASFDAAETRFVGVDISEGMVGAARRNFPERRFDLLGLDLSLPYEGESFDLAFSVTMLHHNPPEARQKLVSEMWRVVRPGGRLLFLESFVTGKRTAKSTVYPMSVLEFEDLIIETTGGATVLEHAEALKYPHDKLFRGGMICFAKLGASGTP